MIDHSLRIEACDRDDCRWAHRCARAAVWKKRQGVEIPMRRGIGGAQCPEYIDASARGIEG